jgi:LIVCS family branched-chain amino acid:cation transporter
MEENPVENDSFQKRILNSNIIATGLAMFSMFFGAGNIVFPLTVDQLAQDKNFFAILGLLITAVGVPFTGLIAMTLFHGNYKVFFDRIGKIPGFLVTVAIMGLIGAFGGIPRCIALSYSTLKIYTPGMPLVIFSIISCLAIYMLTFKKNRIVDILGYVLTPLLILSFTIIVVKGLLTGEALPKSDYQELAALLKGLKDGFLTMDLLAAFFFASVVLVCLKKDLPPTEIHNYKRVTLITFQASLLGALLLSAVYVGFSYVAAYHSEALAVPDEEMLAALARHILGPFAAIIAIIAVVLACLTKAIALSSVFADFLQREVFQQKIGYHFSLIITLFITFLISTLNFMGIASFITPILRVCYPALLVLSILNICYKLYDLKVVKTPVFAVFLITLWFYF